MQVFAVFDSVQSFLNQRQSKDLMMLMPVQILADAGANHPLRLEGTQSALWTAIHLMKLP